MSDAALALYAFVYNAVRGICDFDDAVSVEVVETPPKTVTVSIYVEKFDLRFVFSKIKEIKTIAIAIAQRHHVYLDLIVEEKT